MEMVGCSVVGLHKLPVLVVLLVVASAAPLISGGGASAAAAFPCGDAISALVPCGPFLLGMTGEVNPSATCCRSAQILNKMSATAEMRRQLCKCLTQTGPSFGVLPDRASRLPPFCKLRLDVPISPTMDCNKMH